MVGATEHHLEAASRAFFLPIISHPRTNCRQGKLRQDHWSWGSPLDWRVRFDFWKWVSLLCAVVIGHTPCRRDIGALRHLVTDRLALFYSTPYADMNALS